MSSEGRRLKPHNVGLCIIHLLAVGIESPVNVNTCEAVGTLAARRRTFKQMTDFSTSRPDTGTLQVGYLAIRSGT